MEGSPWRQDTQNALYGIFVSDQDLQKFGFGKIS